MEYIVKWDGIAADITEIAGRYCYPELRKLKADRRGEPIVRCKDCAHMRKSWNGKQPAFVPDGFFCAYWGGHELWELDGFCKWGEHND